MTFSYLSQGIRNLFPSEYPKFSRNGNLFLEKIVEKEVVVEKPKEELLQGNLVKDLPKEEKPTPPNNPWGSPGGSRKR